MQKKEKGNKKEARNNSLGTLIQRDDSTSC